MDSSSKSLRRLQITSSHLLPSLQEGNFTLEENSTSATATGDILPIPSHILNFISSRKNQIIDNLDEAKEILSDSSIFTNETLGQLSKSYPNAYTLFGNMFIFFDPPKHTPVRANMRQMLTSFITSKETEQFIHDTVDQLVANIEKKNGESFDFMEAFARVLPLKLIAFVLGLDLFKEDNYKIFSKWVEIASTYFFEIDIPKLKAIMTQYEEETKEVVNWIRNVLKTKQYFSHGLIYRIVESGLGETEVVAAISLLLFAGVDTTSNLLGNLMYVLAKFPHQYQELRKDVSLVDNAIEETLRMLPSISILRKFVLKNSKLESGRVVKKGFITLCFPLLNRSPKYFTNPDIFDIHRTPQPNRIFTFGHGVHLCLGRDLARLETRIALRKIISKFKDISFDPSKQSEWRESPVLTSLKALHIKMK